jgi:cobalt-zinc-cadmium resistance protein CzcA
MHPLGLLAQLREQEADAWLKVERRRFWPELNIGYLNQSIDKRPNNQVVSLGLSLPLLFRPYRQQIVAARLQKQIATTERALQESQLRRQRQGLQWRQQQVREKLNFYQTVGLINANSLEFAVNTSRRLGEITPFEWLQNINQIAQIRLGYLHSLLDVRLLEADLLYYE